MPTLAQDVRYGFRSLVKNPAFAVVAVLTLGLGIGANTAIFSVVDAVLLRPLPYRDPERLVLIWERMTTTDFAKAPVSAPDVVDYRTETTLFDGVAATNNVNELTLLADDRPEQIKVAQVTANFFDVLGVGVAAGRGFAAADETPIPVTLLQDPNAVIPPGAVLLSYDFWQRRFGGDPAVVGRMLRLGGPAEVVGVLPPHFELLMPPDAGMPTDVDAYTPLRVDLATGPRDNQFLRVIARLAPGATLAAAQAEMDALAARQREQFLFHRNMGMEIRVVPMHGDIVGQARPVLLAVQGAVGCVLLIACANVASLLLARAADRRREMAVRAALGASRGRLIRQVFVEGTLLAAAGGLLGLLFARAGVGLLLALRPANLPRAGSVSVDGRVLVFTLAATAFAAVVFALVPALRASRPDASEALRQRTGAHGSIRVRNALVVVEVALSLVLLIGAGLMLRSFEALQRAKPGFEPAGVMTYAISLPFGGDYNAPAARVRFYQEMEREVAALPGVEAVGSVFPMPLGGRFWTGPYGKAGEPEEEWTKNEANFRVASAGYFEAMGTRLHAGRPFDAADALEDRDVVIVDVPLANRLWPGQPAIGQRLGVDVFGRKRWLEVIGVAEHVRHEDLTRDSRPTIYFSQAVLPFPPMTVAVRTGGDPLGLAGPLRDLVSRLDAEVPIYRLRPLADYVADARAPTRFTLIVIGLFGTVATALAAVGLFGVLAHTVRQRTREIGVRVALGAGRGSILRLVVGRGLLLTLGGLALGLPAALGLTRALSGLLVGVSSSDPLTYAALSAVLVAVALGATYLPAQKATRVEPAVSLRVD